MNFDFVESKPSKATGAADMLDFVEDAPKEADKKMRPAPPVVAKGSKSKEEPFAFGDQDPGQPGGEAARAKQGEKDRKKRELAREREEKARRKALRGPGLIRSTTSAMARRSNARSAQISPAPATLSRRQRAPRSSS